MIHISQGHEKGVGLEVFLKACNRLGQNSLDQIKLYASKEALEETLKSIGFSYSFSEGFVHFFLKKISVHFITTKVNEPLSKVSLDLALKNIEKDDILITLPTSKDQLPLNGVNCSGYTEYFRKYFKNQNICMTFKGPRDNVLLLSDHIPLKEVSKYITKDLIIAKASIALECFPKYFGEIKSVLISGLNPHAGEDGILGDEEKNLSDSMEVLKKSFPKIKFEGFLPGDTLHFHRQKNQLLIYMYHDQGLANFKDRNGLLGINVSLGLSFLRLSVDHGTAFNLYGKNKADCTGCYYVLQHALEVNNNVNQ